MKLLFFFIENVILSVNGCLISVWNMNAKITEGIYTQLDHVS